MSEQTDAPLVDAHEARELRAMFYNATIVERIDHTKDLARFRIRPDSGVPAFEPGQYVTIGMGNWEKRLEGTQDEEVPAKKLRRVTQRAYSISCPLIGESGKAATVDSVDYLEFYITLVRLGSDPEKPPVLTPRLFCLGENSRVMVGRKVTGHYVLGAAVKPTDTVLMLGTGTGEAPHNAMTAKLLCSGHKGRIINVTSVRYAADLAYEDEHKKLMQQHPQYVYLPYTTRDPKNLEESHPNYVGKQYLQQLFTSGKMSEAAGVALEPSTTHVFLCGNPAMIGFTPPGAQPPKQPGMLPLLRDAGFTDDSDYEGPGKIRFEKYW